MYQEKEHFKAASATLEFHFQDFAFCMGLYFICLNKNNIYKNTIQLALPLSFSFYHLLPLCLRHRCIHPECPFLNFSLGQQLF